MNWKVFSHIYHRCEGEKTFGKVRITKKYSIEFYKLSYCFGFFILCFKAWHCSFSFVYFLCVLTFNSLAPEGPLSEIICLADLFLQFFCFEWGKEIWFKGFNVSVFIEMSLLKNKWIGTFEQNASLSLFACLLKFVSVTSSIFTTSDNVYLSVCSCIFMSICLSVHLSLCLFVFLFICLSVYLSFCSFVFLFICLSVHLSFCSVVFLSICLSVHLSFCSVVFLFSCLSVHLSFCSFVFLSNYLPIHFSVCTFVFLSIWLSFHLSFCLFDCVFNSLYFHLSVHPSICMCIHLPACPVVYLSIRLVCPVVCLSFSTSVFFYVSPFFYLFL